MIGLPAISEIPPAAISKYVVFVYLPRSLFIALKLAKLAADTLIVITAEYFIDTVPLNGKVFPVISIRKN